MSGIKSLGLIICILMVLTAYLKRAVPFGKTAPMMKSIISIFIVLSIIEGIKTVNLNGLIQQESDFLVKTSTWREASVQTELGLKNEFEAFINDCEIEAVIKSVKIDGTFEGFEVIEVVVCGKEARAAGDLISGRYHIDESSIEVVNE